jgi:hypothetical protein
MVALRALLALLTSLVGLFLVVPVVLLALPFWVMAGLTSFFRSMFDEPIVSWKKLIEFEPVVGWKPKANLSARAMADEPFHLTTDAFGWRGKRTIAESDLIVFGDSFAFGYGVDDRTMYAETVTDLRIKAVGVNGYNLVQSYLWMERYASLLEGKLVVWLIYHGNDLYENLCPNLDHYRMPFVRSASSGGWEIVTDHVSPDPWPYPSRRQYLEKLAEICTGGFLAERAFGACEFLIERAARTCSESGSELVVVTAPDASQIRPQGIASLRGMSRAPDRFDPDLPDHHIAAICRQAGVRFLALKDHVRAEDFKSRDVHWKPSGHRKFGRVLARLHSGYRWPGSGGDPGALPEEPSNAPSRGRTELAVTTNPDVERSADPPSADQVRLSGAEAMWRSR